MYRVGIALVLLFAGISAASAQSAAPTTVGGGRCIGVVSMVGHKFTLRKVGIMVFGNEDNIVPVNWSGIDDLIVGKVTAFLSKRASVRRLSYSKPALATYENPGGSPFRRPNDELRDIVRTAAASQRCHQHVAVVRWSAQVAGTNQAVTGLGILERAGIITLTELYAVFGMVVFDGKTFEIVRQQRASASGSLFTGLESVFRRVDRSWWPEPSQVAQNAKLRDAVRTMIDQSLTGTLPRVFPPEGS